MIDRNQQNGFCKSLEMELCADTEIVLSRPLDLTGLESSTTIRCASNEDDASQQQHSCTLSGGGTSRIFQLESSIEVSFRGIAFSNGASAANGGIASITGGGVVSVGDCSFLDSIATENGGAIYASGAETSLLMTGCNFKGNSATNGGAIFIEHGAYMSINEARLVSNTATNGNGGALYVDQANVLSKFQMAFKDNIAGGEGNDIYIGDDESPTNSGAGTENDVGSFVRCDVTTIFCNGVENGVTEYGGGFDSIQLYANTNCLEEAGLPKAGECDAL